MSQRQRATQSSQSIATVKTNHQHASTTLVIENIAKLTDAYKEVRFTLSSMDESELYFGVIPKNTLRDFGNDLFVYLLFYYIEANELAVRYKVSIWDEEKEKALYTQEYEWKYNANRKTGNHVAKFISRDQLLKPGSNKLVASNGSLMLRCEVETLSSPVNRFSLKQVSAECDPNLSGDYRSMLEGGKFFDVVLRVGGKELKAHKNILSARSPVFAAMFDNECKQECGNMIEITDVEVDAFEELLLYMYTGKVQALEQHAPDLLAATEKYQLESLKRLCEQQLITSLTTKTVSEYLLLAHMHNATNLKTSCIEFFTDNATDVMSTDGWSKIECKPDLLVSLLRELAAKRQCKK